MRVHPNACRKLTCTCYRRQGPTPNGHKQLTCTCYRRQGPTPNGHKQLTCTCYRRQGPTPIGRKFSACTCCGQQDPTLNSCRKQLQAAILHTKSCVKSQTQNSCKLQMIYLRWLNKFFFDWPTHFSVADPPEEDPNKSKSTKYVEHPGPCQMWTDLCRLIIKIEIILKCCQTLV